MASKTFIKVRVGILEPRHIFQIGGAIWLYLYILNRADWKSGKIFEWRDKDAAADLGVYVQSIRNQRTRLEAGNYISSIQKFHRVEITVNNWHDPSEKVINKNHGDKKITLPSNDGDSHGDMDGDRNLSPLPFNKELRIKNTEYPDDPVTNYISIIGLENPPQSLTVRAEWERSLRLMIQAGATDEMLLRAYVERGTPDPYLLTPIVTRMLREVTA